MTRFIAIASFSLLFGCGAGECPRGSLLDQEGGLVLTADSHPDGWGSADCETCHAVAATHLVSCTPGVDLEGVRAEVEQTGYDGCHRCHGYNGTEPPQDTGASE